jgi:excisionase family DNA binding protein
LRREIDLLSFAPSSAPATRSEAVAASPAPAPFATILLLGPGEGGRRLGPETQYQLTFQVLTTERAIGFEPTTFSLGMAARSVGPDSTQLQDVGTIEGESDSELQTVGPRGSDSRILVPILAPENRTNWGAGERLLSVKEVAGYLGVTTATVYGLCGEGRLAHVRILNVIRVAPGDLDAFLTTRRDGR